MICVLIFMAYANGESGKKGSGENEREQGMKGYEVPERSGEEIGRAAELGRERREDRTEEKMGRREKNASERREESRNEGGRRGYAGKRKDGQGKELGGGKQKEKERKQGTEGRESRIKR